MSRELAFVLINPYTIDKSRTGGVIGRYIRLTGLDLVGARMFGPGPELVERFAAQIQEDPDIDPEKGRLLAAYVRRAYSPDRESGRPPRVLLLLFEGEDAIAKVREATGDLRHNMESGRSVRDIYGDYVIGPDGKVMYVEPAVIIGPTPASVRRGLRLWMEFSNQDGGLIERAMGVRGDGEVEKTLVLIKPDNFQFPSSRPGHIIDIFSGSGLRIIGAKLHHMSIAEALEFYGPVREILRGKLKNSVGVRAMKTLSAEFGFPLPGELAAPLADLLGPVYGDRQFHEIVQFMSGRWAPDVPAEELKKPGRASCLALVYAGPGAVEIIRRILGPTDPRKAEPGSVRRELGHDIMVNAAHASDSSASAEREMGILDIARDDLTATVDMFYPEEK